MAVYTEVPDDELAAFLAAYDIGELVSFKGIAEGVENSNYLLATTKARFILTLYEKRVDSRDLPFFLGLMEHLAERGLTCPLPVKGRDGEALRTLCGRPAALVTFLDGVSVRKPAARHCAELGRALGRLHAAGEGFSIRRPNALSVSGWRPLAEAAAGRSDVVQAGLDAEIAAELDFLEAAFAGLDLPRGVIHADLFPNNVLFLGDRLSGLIDFYFACDDAFAYDVAVCLNSWCFEPDQSFNVTKGRALLEAYDAARPLSEAEIEALPTLARGSAIRFLLTRLVDWLDTPAGAFVKKLDPLEYFRKLRFHQQAASAADYGWRGRAAAEALEGTPTTPGAVEIFTDGACSGNPGPGGWGAILRLGEVEKEFSGGERLTTNNRMELLAAISALEALRRACAVVVHTDSQYLRDGVTRWIAGWKRNGWKTADKKKVKNQDLWERLDALIKTHDIEWRWVKGHAGHPENERADELARMGMKPFKEAPGGG